MNEYAGEKDMEANNQKDAKSIQGKNTETDDSMHVKQTLILNLKKT